MLFMLVDPELEYDPELGKEPGLREGAPGSILSFDYYSFFTPAEENDPAERRLTIKKGRNNWPKKFPEGLGRIELRTQVALE